MQSYSNFAPVLLAAIFLALLGSVSPAFAQLSCVGMAGSTNISINNCTIPPANLGVTGNVAIGSSFVTATPPTNGMIIQGAMGVGTTAPSNLLDVSGGVAIGTQYVGVTTAPTSGLIVQGNVGIGTTNPLSPLQITNSTTYPINPTSGKTALLISGTGASWTSNRILFQGYGGYPMASIDQIDTGGQVSSLAFFTSPTSNSLSEKMRITSSGAVGIGTGSPASLFSVYGGGLAVGTYAATTNIGTGSIIASGKVGIGTSTVTNALDVYGGAAHGAYAGQTAPTNGMIISGAVGIGTNSPLVSLDLSRNTDALALPAGTTGQEPSNAVNGMIRYNSSIPDLEAFIGGYWTTLTTGGSAASIYLGTSRLAPDPAASASDTQTGLYTAGTGKVDVSSQGSQVVEISTSGMNVLTGNVGIGTTSPPATLSVVGAGATNTGVYTQNTGYSARFTAVRTDSSSGIIVGAGVNANYLSFDNAHPLYLGTDTLGDMQGFYTLGLQSTDVTIMPTGLVGIGTTAPSNLLDVNGGVAIGTQYVGVTTAPTSGAIIQGSVGIGTTTPKATLDVNGFTKLALNASAPVACTAATDGSIALTHTRNTCVCVGSLSAWTNMVLGNACIW